VEEWLLADGKFQNRDNGGWQLNLILGSFRALAIRHSTTKLFLGIFVVPFW
jgi:hypothetical protein